MPKPYPDDFRRDVVAVARHRETTLTQIPRDFGISEVTLYGWLKKADTEDGVRPGLTEADAAGIRVLNYERSSKTRTRSRTNDDALATTKAFQTD